LATTIATVLEMNIFPESGGAKEGHMMKNQSERTTAENVTN